MPEIITPSSTPIGIHSMSSGAIAIYVPPEQVESFKKLVQRAMHTWERAPISILEFADYLLDGRLKQDYRNMAVYQRNAEYESGAMNANGHTESERTGS